MADDTASRVGLADTRVKSTLGSLLRRIWRGALANRGLVIAVFALGLVQAFFTKAPFLLVKFLMDALSGTGGVPKKDAPDDPKPDPDPPGVFDEWKQWAEALRQDVESGFREFSQWVNSVLGLGLEQDSMIDIVGCAVVASLAGLFGSFAIYGSMVYSRYLAAKIVVDLRDEVLQHILRLPMRFFSKRRMGHLISSITTDTTVLTRSFTLVCGNAITDPLNLLFNFLILHFLMPEISWVMLIVVPVMAAPMLRTGRRIHKSSSKSLAAMGDSTESMNQMLTGIRTVKSFQLEEERLREYKLFNGRFLHRTKKLLKAKAFSQGFLFASYQVGFAALLCLMGWLVVSEGYKLSIIAAAMLPLATSYQHVKRIVRSFNILCESVGAMEGIESILRVRADVSHDGGKELRSLSGAVEMQGVSFAYDSEQVLHDVSFRVEPGMTVAVVGPSGAGKSTALDLLGRFYDPTKGRVLVDGQDLRDLDLSSYRRHVAVVSQTPFLFNTSIRENIQYGKRDATEEEIHEAARQAHIHDFIISQPGDYDAVVGEQGTNLSGGQRQRITIARAILRDPKILFLDEAMSALDSESEKVVQRALNNLMKGRTSFVIAHRLSTIQAADQILVMEQGRLVQQGTHEQLIHGEGLYSRLYELQQL